MVNRYFQEALSFILYRLGRGSQTELAEKIGILQNYVSALSTGGKKGTEETRRKIAEGIGIGYFEMLEFGKSIVEGKTFDLRNLGDRFLIDKNAISDTKNDKKLLETQKIVVYSNQKMEVHGGLPMGKKVGLAQKVNSGSERQFGIRVGEENMLPYITPGMIVIVDPLAPLESGKLVFCPQECRVFRYFRYGEKVVLRSDNPSARFPDLEYDAENAPEVYRVIKSERTE